MFFEETLELSGSGGDKAKKSKFIFLNFKFLKSFFSSKVPRATPGALASSKYF